MSDKWSTPAAVESERMVWKRWRLRHRALLHSRDNNWQYAYIDDRAQRHERSSNLKSGKSTCTHIARLPSAAVLSFVQYRIPCLLSHCGKWYAAIRKLSHQDESRHMKLAYSLIALSSLSETRAAGNILDWISLSVQATTGLRMDSLESGALYGLRRQVCGARGATSGGDDSDK
ncbi:hypothetical protein PR048_019951 [Dryococelus australis]|uniref:Uncharacterized protein n=1 Tax=Dryococelus australis TaxID=614101 RepID=A0ABQ9H4Y2_9NEOP|nr:hypothetical protein PR048_019951 [Dryococelus australis]